MRWTIEGDRAKDRQDRSGVILYTLVESARTNKLDVYEYLKHLLTEIPGSQYLEHPEVLDQYLPWSEHLSRHSPIIVCSFPPCRSIFYIFFRFHRDKDHSDIFSLQ